MAFIGVGFPELDKPCRAPRSTAVDSATDTTKGASYCATAQLQAHPQNSGPGHGIESPSWLDGSI